MTCSPMAGLIGNARLWPVLSLWLLAGCQTPPAGPPPPLAVAELVRAVEAENHDLKLVFESTGVASKALGEMNGKLQSLGYFRRIPSQPVVDSLRSDLEQAAVDLLLVLSDFESEMAPQEDRSADVVAPGATWSPTDEDVFGRIKLRFSLTGERAAIAQWIDELPRQVERLVVIEQVELRPDGAAVVGEAYYERPLPAPELRIEWPSLHARLEAAGWRPDDPSLRADPDLARLQEQVEIGRARLPDVRHALKITSDFPRWALRFAGFTARATRAATVRAKRWLGPESSPE